MTSAACADLHAAQHAVVVLLFSHSCSAVLPQLFSHPLSFKPRVRVSRTPNADVVLEHPSASRLHAVIQFRGDTKQAFVYDCGSSHGTFLNKEQLKARVHAPLRCERPAFAPCSDDSGPHASRRALSSALSRWLDVTCFGTQD